jgi:putative CocE/NonD family hydrolase
MSMRDLRVEIVTVQLDKWIRTFHNGQDASREPRFRRISHAKPKRFWRFSSLAAIVFFGTSLAHGEYSVHVEKNISAPMRDGVKLVCDIYRPQANENFPVLVVRTPYGRQRAITIDLAEQRAKRGYIVVIQDVRGRGDSEGVFQPFFDDENDGYDTVEWAAGLPHSTGKVAMILSSYSGASHIFAALAHPPHLVTMVVNQPAIGFDSHHIFFEGGAFRQLWAESWTVILASDSYSRTMRRLEDNGSLLTAVMKRLPLGSFMDQLSREMVEVESGAYFREWLSHAPGSSYWDRIDLKKRVADIQVPVLYVGGWYDVFGPATAALFHAVQQNAGSESARTNSRLIIGPWAHVGKSDVDFGPESSREPFNLLDSESQWLDYWLKDENTGVLTTPKVRLFQTGTNRWTNFQQWPVPNVEPYRLFLSSTKSAQGSSGDGALTANSSATNRSGRSDDILIADPSDPVPTVGGELCCHPAFPAGAHYQNEIEKRRDVLVYTTSRLEDSLTIVGEPIVTLHISSDAPDIDLIAKLLDVDPEGKAWNVADGALRLRFRDRADRPEWLVPHRLYEVSIRLGPADHCFLPGHLVRLQIAGSDFPNYSVNIHSKEEVRDGTSGRRAKTSIKHALQLPSFLELPKLMVEPH